MKTKRLCYALFLAIVLAGPTDNALSQNTDGTVTYTVSTVNYNGSYDPKHIAAVWVVNDSGTFVKTLCRHAVTRINYLYKWRADRGTYTDVDGVTSATLSTQPQTHLVTWNCRGTNGQVVADGPYTFRAEYTSSNAQGPYMASNCQFVKGATAVTTNFPNYSNASGQFTSMSLTYTPYAEVALSGLAPNSGVINSNVAVVVTVTNQTLNTLSFAVAVSNITSGTLIGLQPVPALTGKAITNLTFNWNTSGLTAAPYQIRAVASSLATETNTADNVRSDTITLTSATAGDLAVTELKPSSGITGGSVPLQITVTNKVADATGPFLVALSNLTAATTLTSFSNTWRVATSADDAEENLSAHSVNLTSTDLELTYDTSDQVIGIRFQTVDIPRDASIRSAAIQFTDKTGEDLNINPISLTLTGQASDSAETFTTASANISSRPDTAASVAWAPPDWVDAEAGPDQRTPELKDIVQEMVSRPGWNRGNAMAFKITGTGGRRAYSYNGSADKAPLLLVEWTTASHLIVTQQIASLAAYAATSLTFPWNTSGITAGVYQIRAQAGPLASETYAADNTRLTDITLSEPIRDLAIHSVLLTPVVAPNVVSNVIVVVTNQGDLAESASVSLTDITAAPALIGVDVSLIAARSSARITFPWNTAGIPLGAHTLQAALLPVAGETLTADNTQRVSVIVASGMTTNVLSGPTSAWKYMDKGLDITGAPWRLPDYYDGFWASGPAPLGFGFTNIATTISYGPDNHNRYPTTYFRREFIMDYAPMSVTARVMRADGVVLYLNGQEIARHNMPAGDIGYSTLALSAVTGTNAMKYYDFPVAASHLVLGRNLLTAELHLSSPSREAAGFSVELLTAHPTIPPLFAFTPTALEPNGPAQSGDTLDASVTLGNTGNITASGLVLIRDAATGAVLGSQSVGPLVPGETVTVRVTLSTFGAATGSRTLQAVTVINGVTNLTDLATAPFTLDAPVFSPRTVTASGSIGGRCNAVAVSGSTVYLGCGATLEVWDAQDPAAPVRKGIIRLPGIIEDLAATNAWVYAATGAAGVQIIDAFVPTQLLHRATFDSSGFARRVTLANSLLYVADGIGGVRALNISSPSYPKLAGAYPTAGPAQTVTYTSPRLLVLDSQSGLQNLHAATPSTLSVTGTCRQVTAGLALTPVSGAVLATDAHGGLFRINTTDPTQLSVAASTLLPAAGRSLAASGPALYVAAGAQGLLTLDANTLELKAVNALGGEASSVTVSGTTLYVAAGFGGCQALNISSPFAPQTIGTFQTGARAADVAAAGSTLFVAADEGGLQLHSLQKLTLPRLLGKLPSVSNPRCVAVAYPNLFVADGLSVLKSFDLSPSAGPALLGSYDASALSHIRRLALAGNRALLTDGHTIQLLSVADPATPVLLASCEPGGFVFDLAVIPGEAYAACGGAGLKVLRMDTLAEDNTVITPGPAIAVAAISNRLTVACGPAGWMTLNIDNPATPVQVQTTAGAFVFDAASPGPLVYLCDGARTAQVANVSVPLTPVISAAFGHLTAALRVRAISGLMLSLEDEAGLAILNASPGDINLNGIPDEWEQQIVDASVQANGSVRSVLDVDLQAVGVNGFTYHQSYLAGLTPTDPNSVLALSAVTPVPDSGGQITVRWHSVPGKRYTLYKSTDLTGEFTAVPAATGLVATGPETSYTDTVTSARAFYMVVLTPQTD